MKYYLAKKYMRLMRPVARFNMKVAVYVVRERGKSMGTKSEK